MNIITKGLHGFLLISLCLITACTHPPEPAAEEPINKVIPLEKRKKETATVSSWQIRGAMAAKSKNKGWTATLSWMQQGPNAYQIRLIGPLSAGTVLINKKGSTITIEEGGKIDSSTNADALLVKHTGIRLPVNHLYYWVRGLPAPGAVEEERHDRYNHLTELRQSGYHVAFTKFTSVRGIDLPSMIRLTGKGVMIKVVIKSWGN